ncbi:solute carrier family 28 member 3 [Hyalella azteca]|uniref:Sodium/nucleoside cotransporter n=1 Tax=Hyalella azteca TaxID=294128 RepID=A0A8B7P8B4_HYAAZ|nr:solute carrier family 28 member 3 [Hyalella azteca]
MTHNPGFVPDDLTSVDDVELKSVTQEGKRFSADDTAANEVRHRKLSDHVVPTSDDVTEEPDYGILSLIIPGYREKRNDFNEFAERTHFYQRLEQSFYVALTLAFSGYFITALFTVTDLDRGDYWCEGDGLLLVITGCTAIMMLYFLIVKQFYGEQLYHSVVEPLDAKYEMVWKIKMVRWGTYLVLIAALVLFFVFDTSGDRRRLQSLVGLFLLIFLGFVFSFAPRKVIWRQVLWGLALQFILGLLILRWPVGRKLFECLGDKVAEFLAFTDEGSKFVFGDLLVVDDGGIFAFKVLPVTLFFSFCIQILYYYGIMQWVVLKLGWLLQVSIGTTACESVNASANIFLGQTEAPLLIRPFIHLMTMSELHAVMTGGFATIAGSVMAAYISFGVSASHLLSASVMSAPAALAYSKLFYPETEVSKTTINDIPIVKSEEANVLHAAVEGVVAALPLVANIAANLITFIAFIAFFNAVFDWSCVLVGAEEGVCTLENVFGYIFMPLAWSMGVPWDECHAVGTLLGLKTIVNEFVAYSSLSEMIKAGTISPRAEIIATYALCGFSNIGSIGIQLGGIGALAPSRRPDIAKIVVRAMIAGNAACFLTACIAGTLLDDASLERDYGNSTMTSL